MINAIKKNKILILILVIVIIMFVVYGMSDKKPQQGTIQRSSAVNISPVEQEILKLLMDIESIKMDNSIFKDPAFGTLRDFGRDVVQEPIGKENPFRKDDNRNIVNATSTVISE